MNGWIKMHRKSMDSSIWKNSVVWMVWSWCLMKANHKDNEFPFNGEDITIKSGQFITGREKAVSEIPISPQNWKTAIKYLKSTNRITTKSTNKFTIITIMKWEEYQVDDDKLTSKSTSKLNNHQPATNQPLTTNKNDKKEKNDKNNTSEQSSQANKIMDMFYKLNPMLDYKKPFNRKACDDMIKKFGLEDTKAMAEKIISVQGKPYAPVATTPYQMKEKLAQFKLYFDKEKNNKPKVSIIS